LGYAPTGQRPVRCHAGGQKRHCASFREFSRRKAPRTDCRNCCSIRAAFRRRAWAYHPDGRTESDTSDTPHGGKMDKVVTRRAGRQLYRLDTPHGAIAGEGVGVEYAQIRTEKRTAFWRRWLSRCRARLSSETRNNADVSRSDFPPTSARSRPPRSGCWQTRQ